MRAVLLLAFLFPFAAPSAFAQGNSSSPVSRELAGVLITAFGIGAPESLKVNFPAAGFPAGVLPRSALVLGSFNSGSRSITIAETSQIFAAADQEIRAAFTAAGWMSVAATASVRAGFAPPVVIDTVRASLTLPPATIYCRGTENIQYRPSRAIRTSTVITFTHARNLPPNSCNPVGASAGAANENPIPLLVAPPGSRPYEGSTSAGGGMFQSSMRLASTLSVSDLSDYFAELFVADGWTQFDAAASGQSAMRSFSKPVPAGGLFVAVFTQVTLPDNSGIQLHVWVRRR